MALLDAFTNLLTWARWLHVVLGMFWVGHLYFFEFVVMPVRHRAGVDLQTKLEPVLLRALSWFRWSGLAAVGSGLLLLVITYFYTPGRGLGPTSMFIDGHAITDRAVWIFFGMAIAVWMWFNVWFVFEPAEQKLLRGKVSAEEIPLLRRRSLLSLRLTAFISGPMLFAMIAPAHYGAFSFTTMGLVAAISVLVVWSVARLARR